MNLSTKIGLLTFVATLATGVVLGALGAQETENMFYKDATTRGEVIAHALAETQVSRLVKGDVVDITHSLRRIVKSNNDVKYIYITDFNGKMFAHSFEGGIPVEINQESTDILTTAQTHTHALSNEKIVEVSRPIMAGLPARVSIGLETAQMTRKIEQTRWQIMFAALFIGLFIALVTSLYIRRVVAPIHHLSTQMEGFGRQEKFDSREIPKTSTKEVRALYEKFYQMVDDRRKSHLDLQNFKNTLDRTKDCVFMFYPDNLLFFYVNQGAIEQVGYGHEELLRMHPYDIKPDYTELKFREMIQPLLSSEISVLNFETRHRHRDGHDVPVDITLQYIHDAGHEARFVAIVRDITERKRAELELQKLNQDLESRVEQRTFELAQSNNQLKQTIATLNLAQDELVRSEKLASLGSLVAGVAHEMSTPLGNSLMVSTTLADKIKRLDREVINDNLSRSELMEFISHANHAAELLNRNLLRASELINHFKQVAVDQTSAKRREFDLSEVLIEVLETLQPRFKKTPHQLQFSSKISVRMDSYPGPLGQVVTNLVLNSLTHGFENIAQGEVSVSIEPIHHDWYRITVSDNGRGIAQEHLSKVFDPFFTTKLGQGGSGLGLHIAYTIVHRVLGGHLLVESEINKGATFIIEIPKNAPVQHQLETNPEIKN